MTHSGDISVSLLSLTATFLSLALVFVILRFWARYTTAATYGADDWLIVAGMVCRSLPTWYPTSTEGSYNSSI